MFYVADGLVYLLDEDGQAHGVDVSTQGGPDPSSTFEVLEGRVPLPEGAVRATREEVLAKFNLADGRELRFPRAEKPKKKTKEA